MDSNARTAQRPRGSPTAILVGLPETLATKCTSVLEQGGLNVLRVSHVAAACERIPVVMPHLAIVLELDLDANRAEMRDSCAAVGAELVDLAGDTEDPALTRHLDEASGRAFVRSLQRR